MEKRTIIVVEDDRTTAAVIQSGLEQNGYRVLCACNGAELLKLLEAHDVQTILLDLGLPDTDGLDLIVKAREHTSAPIIIVSGKDDLTDKIVGMEMGADDYVTKPFELKELLVRVKANVRRFVDINASEKLSPDEKKVPKRVKFGTWILDCNNHQIYNDGGTSGELTIGEYKLLETLVLSPKRVFARDRLFKLLRNDTYDGYDRALDVHIMRIRKKIGDKADSPSIIQTVRGVGYVLICDTKTLA